MTGSKKKKAKKPLTKKDIELIELELKEMKKEAEQIEIEKKKIEKMKKKGDVEMTVRVLYFESENTARLIDTEIKDGMVMIDDKAYPIDTHYPIMLKLGSIMKRHKPMFILKHDKLYPASNLNKIKPDFEIKDKKGNVIEQEINPEVLKKTMNMKVLGNMLKVRKETDRMVLLAMGVVAGAVLIYLAIEFNLISIG